MLIYAQAESSQTLWLTCVVKLAVLSLWKLDALVWRADAVSCDFSQRVVSLWYHLMLPTVLVFWFCLVHFILLMSWWCSARPIRLRRSLTAEQLGLALFLSRAWLHCEGGEERKTKITSRTDCSLSSSFSTSSSWKPTVHDLLSTKQTHWVQRATFSSFKRPMFSTQGVRNSDGWNMKKCRSALWTDVFLFKNMTFYDRF